MKEDVYRDVKTQKACEQGWEANIYVYINMHIIHTHT